MVLGKPSKMEMTHFETLEPGPLDWKVPPLHLCWATFRKALQFCVPDLINYKIEVKTCPSYDVIKSELDGA